MSYQAHNWAMDVPVEHGQQRLLLAVLGDVSDQDGVSWPSLAYLARKALMSEATARRHLRGFEERGVLAIFARSAECGRQRSNEYRLNMARDPGSFGLGRDAGGPHDGGDDGGEGVNLAPSQRGEGISGDTLSPVLPSHGCKGDPVTAVTPLDPSGDNITPLSPPEAGRPGVAEARREPDSGHTAGGEAEGSAGCELDGFDAFVQAYPEAVLDAKESRKLWAAMTAAERQAATAAAPVYGRACAKAKRRVRSSAHFLRQRLWETLPVEDASKATTGQVFVAQGSDAFRAWQVFRGCYGKTIPDGHGGSGAKGWWFPTEWPPFGRGFDPEAQGVFVISGSQQWWAWQTLLRKHAAEGSGMPEGSGAPIRQARATEPEGARGWTLPSEWPPPVAQRGAPPDAGAGEGMRMAGE